jgi:hypothetical protein
MIFPQGQKQPRPCMLHCLLVSQWFLFLGESLMQQFAEHNREGMGTPGAHALGVIIKVGITTVIA